MAVQQERHNSLTKSKTPRAAISLHVRAYTNNILLHDRASLQRYQVVFL